MIVEKRSVRLKVFQWKTASGAYALPPDFHRYIYNQKNSETTAIGTTVRPRSVTQVSGLHFVHYLNIFLITIIKFEGFSAKRLV